MNKCIAISKAGRQCRFNGKTTPGGHYCATHYRIYTEENPDPSALLSIVPGPGSDAALSIFNALRSSPTILSHMVFEMYSARIVYPPKINANKFITGSIGEILLTEAISATGFAVKNVAAETSVVDIVVTVNGNETAFSLKNSGNIAAQPILENYRADQVVLIRDLPPTLIFYTEPTRWRIVFLDHAIIRKAFEELSDEEFIKTVYKQSHSNLTFASSFLKKLIPRLPNEYILTMEGVPQVPALAPSDAGQLALNHVRELLRNATA